MIYKNNVLEEHEELKEVKKAIEKLRFSVSKLKGSKPKNGIKRDIMLQIRKEQMQEDLVSLSYHFEKYVISYLNDF